MIRQHPHRGIYERLWSEHKYSVMAVSGKAFTGMSTKLGKTPRILSLIKHIGEYAFEKKPEMFNALLSTYVYVKDSLQRTRQEEIVRTILKDEPLAASMIWQEAVNAGESVLYGCRVFFDEHSSILKFWDSGDCHGLWVCLGAFQMHFNIQEVFNRIALQTNLPPYELYEILKKLSGGMEYDEFQSLSADLLNTLRNNNAVAEPGRKYARLHPRFDLNECDPGEVRPLEVPDCLTYSGLLLEAAIDKAEYPPEFMGEIPSLELMSEQYGSDDLCYVLKPDDYNLNAAAEDLKEVFKARAALDCGDENSGFRSAGDSVNNVNFDEDTEVNCI